MPLSKQTVCSFHSSISHLISSLYTAAIQSILTPPHAFRLVGCENIRKGRTHFRQFPAVSLKSDSSQEVLSQQISSNPKIGAMNRFKAWQLLGALLLLVQSATASHFRHGMVTFTAGPGAPGMVRYDFLARTSWLFQVTSSMPLSCQFGNVNVASFVCTNVLTDYTTCTSTFQPVSLANDMTMRTCTMTSCCRIGTLVNGRLQLKER